MDWALSSSNPDLDSWAGPVGPHQTHLSEASLQVSGAGGFVLVVAGDPLASASAPPAQPSCRFLDLLFLSFKKPHLSQTFSVYLLLISSSQGNFARGVRFVCETKVIGMGTMLLNTSFFKNHINTLSLAPTWEMWIDLGCWVPAPGPPGLILGGVFVLVHGGLWGWGCLSVF